MAAGHGGRWTARDGNVINRSYQIHAKIHFIWSVTAFPRLNIVSRKAQLGCQSAAVRPIDDGHTGFRDASSDYAGRNEPGARWRWRHRRQRQRKRRPPVSTYTPSTKRVAAGKRAIHVVAPPPGGIRRHLIRIALTALSVSAETRGNMIIHLVVYQRTK
jgi:hypothetical protein